MPSLRESRSPTPPAGLRAQGAAGPEAELGAGRTIRCRRCGQAVSDSRQVFAPGGSSARRIFANPAGRVFELLTVRRADSVVPWGEPMLEHTWFAGYAWRPLTCAAGHHLGWRFDAIAGAEPACFFGFITAEVVEDDS